MPTAALALFLGSALAVAAGDPRYVDDFEFIRSTVAQKGAAVHVRKLDWKAICDRFEPRFASASTDADHVKNVPKCQSGELDGSNVLTPNTEIEASRMMPCNPCAVRKSGRANFSSFHFFKSQ